MESDPYAEQRARMVADQIARRGLHDARLLEAFRRVPRHLFVPEKAAAEAYADYPLQIGFNQTISQPYIVAIMTSLLQLDGCETVLEIGTGSGYQAAILASLTREVHTVEYLPELASSAGLRLKRLGFQNVHVHQGDGSCGWPGFAPYSRILVTAASPAPPQPLLDQLADGGRMVIPIGPHHEQSLQVWQREKERLDYENIIPVVFVPLKGKFGWQTGE